MNLKQGQRIDEYVLSRRLSSYSHVWLAFDEGGQREVVLKFVEDQNSADREGNILADIDHPNILKLLRKFTRRGLVILVFEYVPGQRLDKAIKEGLSRENSFRICLNICSALSAIHRYGLFHGDLSPFNVIWSAEKGKAYLIDFGAMGGCTILSAAPEHNPEHKDEIGPHTDIVGLGRILMMLLPRLKGVYDRCLYDDITLRPTADSIFRDLERARDRHKVILRFMITMSLVLIVGVASAFVINHNRPLTPDQIVQQLSETPSQENISQLRQHLKDEAYREYRDIIIRNIARHNQALGQDPVIAPDLENYVAIFAFEHDPLVILEEGTLQLGDWATLANENGYLAEINRGSVIMKTDNGSKEIRYPKPEIFGSRDQAYKPINILPGKINFIRILKEISRINRFSLIHNNEIDGILAGGFNANNYSQFFELLVSEIKIEGYNILVRESSFPRSIISAEEHWSIDDLTLSKLISGYEPFVGFKCVFNGKNDLEGYSFPVMQFHELIDTMDLQFEFVDQTIFVREGD